MHIFQSNSRHGVHSPFVYQLVDKTLYSFQPRSYEQGIEELRGKLKRDKRMVKVLDLGAGSMLNTNKERPVSSIARNALKPVRIARLLGRIAAEFEPESIIELGTCLGITTAYLAKSSPNSQIITVEGCPETGKIAQENFHALGLNKIDLRIGNFDQVLPGLLKEQSAVGLLFIDGNHTKAATLHYFQTALPYIKENSVLIFDDIYWSKEMKEAWKEIKDHPAVTVTIDLFYIGLVFFKKDQQKENFKIRFY